MGQKTEQPVVLAEGSYSLDQLNELAEKRDVWQRQDLYQLQLEELFEIKHPELVGTEQFQEKQSEFIAELTQDKQAGTWVYYPWSGRLLRVVNEGDYFSLRTNRNQLIINQGEQAQLKNATIAVAGLSVGGNIAYNLATNGFSQHLKLADFDKISTTNLNRLYSPIYNLGLGKLTSISRKIYELNPYQQITAYRKLTQDDLDSFVEGQPETNLVIDEVDDFQLKVRLRQAAKRCQVPLIMMTSLADSVLVDVERYDLDPGLQLFNGLVEQEDINKILSDSLSQNDIQQLSASLVGVDNVSTRALKSLTMIGKKLVGRPQVASTVIASSGVASFVARMVLLGRGIKSGRYKIDLMKLLEVEEVDQNSERQKILKQLQGE